MGPRAGLEGGKSRPTRIPSPDRPSHSQSLYRLSYPAHWYLCNIPKYFFHHHHRCENLTSLKEFPVPGKLLKTGLCVSGNSDTPSCNRCCCGKAAVITHSECVSVALVIQHAKRMFPVILSCVACPSVCATFFTLSDNRHDFRKSLIEPKICVLIFSKPLV